MVDFAPSKRPVVSLTFSADNRHQGGGQRLQPLHLFVQSTDVCTLTKSSQSMLFDKYKMSEDLAQ